MKNQEVQENKVCATCKHFYQHYALRPDLSCFYMLDKGHCGIAHFGSRRPSEACSMWEVCERYVQRKSKKDKK